MQWFKGATPTNKIMILIKKLKKLIFIQFSLSLEGKSSAQKFNKKWIFFQKDK